ncbi:MAG TPA: SpoIID/LytB domain-containing protein [Gaiellaceae bacterium]|nr:SpoIID/LytB domain-containing protein [Gaiellaceae bacterium]
MGRPALRLGVLCALVCAGAAASVVLGTANAAGPATTTTTPTLTTITSKGAFVLTGHGWGHGIGMSQWGAYGYAKHGWTFDKILAHYYVGTSLGSASVSTVRVLVAQGKKEKLTATTVTDSAGHTLQLSGPVVLTPALTVSGEQLTPPLTFTSTDPIAVNGVAYRGDMSVQVSGKTLLVIDDVALDSYVKGVVPSEMPSTWSAAALDAQAVAARSYALANLAKDAPYDLFGDGRSQVYGGVKAETDATNAAVDATRGQVVTYKGKVADTLYFSSSGGRTVSALEATGVAVPYLQSVADPYDTLSPHHNWGPVVVDFAKVAKALKLTSPIDDIQIALGASGRVHTATIVTDAGSQTFTGSRMRTALGLQSTWFTPSLLELVPPIGAVPFGSPASLTGFARGAVSGVTLEERPLGGTWQPVGAVDAATDGTFDTAVTPDVTTQYRLAWGNVRVGLAKVSVAPLVTASVTTGAITGSLQPVLAGVEVDLQIESGTVWATVASTLTDSTGAWSFTGTLEPGAYRVRCAPANGLAAGVSTAVQVS